MMSDELRVNIYQFLSRRNLPVAPVGRSTSSPRQEPDITFHIAFEYAQAPFGISFLDDEPDKRPKWSMGADQYVDRDRDDAMLNMWPGCLIGTGYVTSATSLSNDDEVSKKCLRFMRQILRRCSRNGDFSDIADQMATVDGYRRAYFQSQILDINGKRRPSHSRTYARTEITDFIGPGLATINDVGYPRVNELAWCRIVPFNEATRVEFDLAEIHRREDKIRLHSNSHKDLSKAKEFLDQGNFETCIRTAAAATEARIKYWCAVWSVTYPTGSMSFDDRIEHSLAGARKPSYRMADPTSSENLLYLYRARNAMHEGDCFYRNRSGLQVDIVRQEQAEPLLAAAVAFAVWIDAIV